MAFVHPWAEGPIFRCFDLFLRRRCQSWEGSTMFLLLRDCETGEGRGPNFTHLS